MRSTHPYRTTSSHGSRFKAFFLGIGIKLHRVDSQQVGVQRWSIQQPVAIQCLPPRQRPSLSAQLIENILQHKVRLPLLRAQLHPCLRQRLHWPIRQLHFHVPLPRDHHQQCRNPPHRPPSAKTAEIYSSCPRLLRSFFEQPLPVENYRHSRSGLLLDYWLGDHKAVPIRRGIIAISKFCRY
jgi:hypothetical protein